MPNTLLKTLPNVSPFAVAPKILPSTLPPVAADVDVVVDEDTDDEVDVDELAPPPTPPQLENKTALIATATETKNFFIFSFLYYLKLFLSLFRIYCNQSMATTILLDFSFSPRFNVLIILF